MAILLSWGASADKKYESGVDRGVVYIKDGTGAYKPGAAWEGLINVTEKPGGDEPTDLWANNAKYAQLLSAPTFEGSIEAYTYPTEFLAADGVASDVTGSSQAELAQQARATFGLSYRTWIGSDDQGQYEAYRIHCVYGCVVQPSEVARATINDSPEAITFNWEFKTTPVATTNYGYISKMTFDSDKLTTADLTAIEEQLYGDDTPTDAELLLPDAMLALLTGI